jgi:uncharacterized protein (DUF1778 family)
MNEKKERLEFRIKKETKEIIREAANLIGVSLSTFVINSAL